MALNDETKRTLSERLMKDKEFREKFLADPRGASKAMGVELSDEDHQTILDHAERIRDAAEEADRGARRSGGPNPIVPMVLLVD